MYHTATVLCLPIEHVTEACNENDVVICSLIFEVLNWHWMVEYTMKNHQNLGLWVNETIRKGYTIQTWRFMDEVIELV